MRSRVRCLAVAALVVLAPVAGCLGSEENDRQTGIQAAGAGNASTEISAGYRVTPFDGAEPKMGATSDGTLWMSSRDEMLVSRDGGESWSVSWEFAPQDDGTPAGQRGLVYDHDPMMAVDPATDRVFYAGMWPVLACSYLAWTDGGGQSWTQRGPACPLGTMDHQKLVLGPRPDATPPVDQGSYPSVAYLCYSSAALSTRGEPIPGPEATYWQVRCATSYDGGEAWTTRTVVANSQTDDCATTIGAPDVGPNGTVALPTARPGYCEPAGIAISQDTGLSWRMLEPPLDQAARSDDPMIRFGPNGTLWMAYTGLDNRKHVVGTPDLGDTWYGPVDVTPPGVDSTVFNALGVGADGRLALAFLGTDDTDRWADDAGDKVHWHLHAAAVRGADSGGTAVETVQITPDEDPVQVGRICMSGVTCSGSRNLLDFIGGTVAPNGTFYVAYTEGCVDACASASDPDPEDSRARRTAAAWVDGWSGKR